jgi:hypothetical protein
LLEPIPAIPFGRRKLLAAAHQAEVFSGWACLGQLPGDAPDALVTSERTGISREARCRPTGHSLDVNQNVYTQPPVELRKQAVDLLERVLPVM